MPPHSIAEPRDCFPNGSDVGKIAQRRAAYPENTFVDIGRVLLDQIESALTPRTKAILPVHFGGHPCDMDRIHQLARQHGLTVIEDAAHAVPARYRGRPVGSISEGTRTCRTRR